MEIVEYYVKVLKMSGGYWSWRLCTNADWVNSCVLMSNPEQRITKEEYAQRLGKDHAIHRGHFKGFL